MIYVDVRRYYNDDVRLIMHTGRILYAKSFVGWQKASTSQKCFVKNTAFVHI